MTYPDSLIDTDSIVHERFRFVERPVSVVLFQPVETIPPTAIPTTCSLSSTSPVILPGPTGRIPLAGRHRRRRHNSWNTRIRGADSAVAPQTEFALLRLGTATGTPFADRWGTTVERSAAHRSRIGGRCRCSRSSTNRTSHQTSRISLGQHARQTDQRRTGRFAQCAAHGRCDAASLGAQRAARTGTAGRVERKAIHAGV